MESAIKKELTPFKSRNNPQIVTSDRFKHAPQQINIAQKRRDTFFALQEIISRLHQPDLSHAAIALQVQHFFEELVYVETGLQSIRHGLRLFLDKLCAEPVITKLMQYLFKQMQKLATARHGAYPASDRSILIAALQELFDWYADRSASIEDISSDESLDQNYDRIFNLKVLHDQKLNGFFGFELIAGIALFGRAGQNLWFKVFVKENGEYILPHVEWNSWIDDTEIFTVRRVGEGIALSSITPISPQTQRLVIDRLNVFVPYQALDLDPGKHNVQIEACLYNEKGDRLLEAASDEVVSVSRNRKETRSIVSQQALGIWSKDFITGDSISNLEIACVQQPNSNWFNDLIRIRFDLEVYDRLNELLSIEVRFYNSKGGLIKASKGNAEDPYLALKKEIYLDEIIFRRLDLELVVPRGNLSLDEDEKIISTEVSLISRDGRVLCGALDYCLLPTANIVLKPEVAEQPVIKESAKQEKKGFIAKLFTKNVS